MIKVICQFIDSLETMMKQKQKHNSARKVICLVTTSDYINYKQKIKVQKYKV